jgi:hypothetical protein
MSFWQCTWLAFRHCIASFWHCALFQLSHRASSWISDSIFGWNSDGASCLHYDNVHCAVHRHIHTMHRPYSDSAALFILTVRLVCIMTMCIEIFTKCTVLKGTQDWELFWLRFWILCYFNVRYSQIWRFCKQYFLIRPLLGEIQFFRLVWD